MSIPSWVIAMCPLVGLLAILTIVWWFVRRGIGAVHRAASFGDVEKLTTLLTARPDSVNECDAIGLTPLQYAACWSQLSATKLLIERGADVNLAKSWTPLHYASADGQEKLATALLDAGADINIRSKADDTTPLHVATVKRQGPHGQFSDRPWRFARPVHKIRLDRPAISRPMKAMPKPWGFCWMPAPTGKRKTRTKSRHSKWPWPTANRISWISPPATTRPRGIPMPINAANMPVE